MEPQTHNLSSELHRQPAEQCATTQNQPQLARDPIALQEPTSSYIQHQAASNPSFTKTGNGTNPPFESGPTVHTPLTIKIPESADLHRNFSVRHPESEATSPPELSKTLPKRASISFKDNKYKKQAVLVPRQIQRPGNVIMTSSENSVYGSAASSMSTSSYVDTQTYQPSSNEGVVEIVEAGANSSGNMESTLVADDATSDIDAGTIDGQRNGTPTTSPTLNRSPSRASRSSSMAATISTRPEATEGGKEQGTLAWCKEKILSCCCCDHGDDEEA